MSVSILWAAFDDVEVERVWTEVPVGELIALLKTDEFFLNRLKKGVSREQALNEHRCFDARDIEPLQRILGQLDKKATLKEAAIEAAKSDKLSYDSLLLLDNRLIDYFTYDAYAERLDNWCTAADALLYGQTDSIKSIDIFISEQFRKTIRTASFDSVKGALRTMLGKNQVSGAYRSPLARPDEDIEYFLEQFTYLNELFDFAEEHSLEVYVETSMGSDFSDFGGGDHNLVTRFKRRFAGIRFPSEWQKFEISEEELHLMQKVGKDTSKYRIKPAEPQQPKATGFFKRISNLLWRK